MEKFSTRKPRPNEGLSGIVFTSASFYTGQGLKRSPKVYDVEENFHLIVAGFTEEYAIGANLSAYLVGMLPAQIANLKTAIERSSFLESEK